MTRALDGHRLFILDPRGVAERGPDLAVRGSDASVLVDSTITLNEKIVKFLDGVVIRDNLKSKKPRRRLSRFSARKFINNSAVRPAETNPRIAATCRISLQKRSR